MSKRKNNLFTHSYFRMRLSDAGIKSSVLVKDFAPNDERYWAISVFEKEKVFCICHRKDGDSWFVFYDGHLFPYPTIVKTQSMNVILNILFSRLNALTNPIPKE